MSQFWLDANFPTKRYARSRARRHEGSVKGLLDRAISLAALAKSASASPRGPIIGTGEAEREEWIAKAEEYANVVDQACFCTHAAQVEVDPETGQVNVLRYVAAQDVGRAINRMHVIGQVEGAVVHGLGYALSEELLVEDGRVASHPSRR